MKSVVIYDSAYGNTKQLAGAIADALQNWSDVSSLRIDDAPTDWTNYNLVVIGSPTQGGTYTKSMKEYLASVKELAGKSVAVFDTRFNKHSHGRALQLLMNIIGFAAEKLARNLEKRGSVIVGQPIGFIVGDTEGPLIDKELMRAKDWISQIVTNEIKGG